MRTLFVIAVLALTGTTISAQEAWKGYNQGITWEDSLDSAKAKATREGKPILLHQLVGDMNLEGC